MDEEQGQGQEQGNQLVESGKKAVQESAEKAAQKVTQKMAKETTKKVAAKASLMGPLGHIIAIAAPILIIIIILGGIILFLLTAPGMVIEKLKGLGKALARGMASWFGADDTEMVDDTVIYQTLDYLEEMGYDLKGYGFLTDYLTQDDYNNMTEKEKNKIGPADKIDFDDEVGVIRDENGKVAKAESQFILTYLVSDNYVYTLKNKNLVTGDGWFWDKLKALDQQLQNFFYRKGYNTRWTRGLIALYKEDGGIGKRGGFYTDTGIGNFDKVDIDPESKTLTLKKGQWFNSNGSMKYSLDGWTGRYGMPLEFLLAVHVSTMMPDLAYDMASSFETEISMLLHPVKGSDVTAGFKAGDKYVEYGDIKDIWGMGVLETREKAMKIMKDLGIPCSKDCTGAAKEKIGTTTVEGVESKALLNDKAIEEYNNFMEEIKKLGYAGDELPTSITNKNVIDTEENKKTSANNNENGAAYENYEYYYTTSKTIFWTGTNPENGEECEYSVTITISHYSIQNIEYFLVSHSAINRSWTSSEWDEAVENKKEELAAKDPEKNVDEMTSEEILGTQKCNVSSDECTKACANCTSYIKKIVSELKKANDGDFAYYVPYIENVTDHWYRDVYFTNAQYDSNGKLIKENELTFVDYDYDYEAVMRERWTAYENDENGEYKLYAVSENGEYATSESQIKNYDSSKFEKEGNYYVFKGTQEEAKGLEISVSKKARVITASENEKLQDLGWSNENSSGIWTAYEDDGELATSWEPTYPDDEDEIKQKIYTRINSDSNIVQVGEGQRTETNPKIKKMFLNNKYLKYDGTSNRAEQITKLRKEKMQKNDDDEIYYGPLRESDLKNEEISKYASKVSLNQDSLNAFSMLENMHTLDADYIYRDFKELIVELGYFTKEELTDETPRLLQWLIPDIASGGYPNRAIDKNENEFGTMLHSRGDIEANEKNTLQAILGDDIEIEGATEDEMYPKEGAIQQDAKINTELLTDSMQSTTGSAPIKSKGNGEIKQEAGDESCEYYVNVNGVKYKHFFQYEHQDVILPRTDGNGRVGDCGCRILFFNFNNICIW